MKQKIIRTDNLSHKMTASKEVLVRDMLRKYQQAAVVISKDYWKLFFKTGELNQIRYKGNNCIYDILGNSTLVQMCENQVIEQIQGWLSNQKNEIKQLIKDNEVYSDEEKHMLYTINVYRAWLSPKDIIMKDTGEIIPDYLRRIARKLFLQMTIKNKKPDIRNIGMRLDQRLVKEIKIPNNAMSIDNIVYWLKLFIGYKKSIYIPIIGYHYHNNREGIRCKTINIFNDTNNQIKFSIFTDISGVYQKTKDDYIPLTDYIALDFGLTTLFTSNTGDQFGRNWLYELKKYDIIIQDIQKHYQRNNIKLSSNEKYKKVNKKLKGFIRTEINRVLNHIAVKHKPAKLILEKLDFRHQNLSRQLNRILGNCGRGIIKEKLKDLEQKYGIQVKEINAAYTSQTCSNPLCGYVDKKNRNGKTFKCLCCGMKMDADVNGARNIGSRRTWSNNLLFASKKKILSDLVKNFTARLSKGLVICPQVVLSKNHYFE